MLNVKSLKKMLTVFWYHQKSTKSHFVSIKMYLHQHELFQGVPVRRDAARGGLRERVRPRAQGWPPRCLLLLAGDDHLVGPRLQV